MSSKGYFALSLYWFENGVSKENKSLILFDSTGNVIKDIPNVPLLVDQDYKYYSWSPDGKSIVYVTAAALLDSKWGPFEPTGVWIYDIEKDTKTRIADKCFGVNWSIHDNNIYMQGRFKDTKYIYVYNTTTGGLRKNAEKGLFFSDDGIYSVGSIMPDEMGETKPYFIFSRKSGKSIYQFKNRKKWWAGGVAKLCEVHLGDALPANMEF